MPTFCSDDHMAERCEKTTEAAGLSIGAGSRRRSACQASDTEQLCRYDPGTYADRLNKIDFGTPAGATQLAMVIVPSRRAEGWTLCGFYPGLSYWRPKC